MENLKILIIENESLVALEMMQTIKSFGYSKVDYVTNSKMAMELLKKDNFDLILMDINLGEGIDGIELYQNLGIDTPIIYITAYKDDTTIQRAIQTNPIGYLVKPHNDSELKALLLLAKKKINNISQKEENSNIVSLGEGYYFNTNEDKLFYNDVFIHLGKKELLLLKLLINARGNVISYYTIEQEIWGSQSVSDSTIRTLIYRLRGKLEHKLIESATNYGIYLKNGKF